MTLKAFIQLGHYRYFPNQKKLLDTQDQEPSLRAQSLAVLHLLASDVGEVVAKDKIFDSVWPDVSVTDDSLVQCIADIRRVLGDKKHEILLTVPRRGYKLVSSPLPESVPQEEQSEQQADSGATRAWHHFMRRPAMAMLTGIIAVALLSSIFWPQPDKTHSAYKQAPSSDNGGYASTLHVALSPGAAKDKSEQLEALRQEIQVALGRYSSVQLLDHAGAEYQLLLDEHTLGGKAAPQKLTLQLNHSAGATTLLAESYKFPKNDSNGISGLAVRAAAAVASPGVGAIGQHLLKSSRLKPVEELTPAECYAHGYGCSKCSGEEDNVNYRAEACLANLLEKNPGDSKAWALQATMFSHQYWFGTTLSEPKRSSSSLRADLPAKAIAAANKAEALSQGNDSAVYWGMAEAYYASCQIDKLQATIQRGLEVNPDDPNLLAAFGSWLTYSGEWDEGSALTKRALEIESSKPKKWWLMAPAKQHYYRGEYQQAYAVFMKSFNERNWLSHLQLAYTLPHLNRLEEAREAVSGVQRLLPGFTIENALEFYKKFCFKDDFLIKIKQALLQAGLPTRGNSDDLNNIQPLQAKTISVNGTTIEYMDVGEGEPIVFVHGSISDYRTWSHYLLPISENHRYISYSQRYFGTQPWSDQGEHWSIDTFANDLIGFVEALNIGPVHLVSWSSSGPINDVAMVKRPDLFKSAVHYEPVTNTIMEGDKEAAPYLKKWSGLWGEMLTALKAGNHERASELMLENVFELEPGGFEYETEAAKELIHHNSRTLQFRFGPQNKGGTKVTCEYLKQVKTPTLIILGESTHKYWALMSKKFADCTPGSQFRILQGTNHKGPVDKVREFADLIIEFVAKH